MVAEEFFKLAGDFKLSTYVGVEDFADRLNFLFSVVLIILSLMVVTIKSYFFKPLACYTATTPSGSNFDNYLENYCWVHGTIAIKPGEALPSNPESWAYADEVKRITYYQWVPFILGLQCIMFYLPRVLWELLCYSKAGADLQGLVKDAHDISKLPPDERKDVVSRIARTIEDMLFQHREYRTGKIARIRMKIYKNCSFCTFSKHLGTWLVVSYLAMKCLYAANVVGQLFLMKKFLGFDGSISLFGFEILRNISNGINWHQTGIFPRVTYCYLGEIRHLGANNKYVAQCALPINMLNEKIYIFLWFWILFVGIITLISIPTWFVRLAFANRRTQFIKRFLSMKDCYVKSEKVIIDCFIREFLRHDGIFLLRMIFINAGDIVTSDIVTRLYQIYKEHYRDCDLRHFNNFVKEDAHGTVLKPNGPPSIDSTEKQPINFV